MIEELWPDPDRRAGALKRLGETVRLFPAQRHTKRRKLGGVGYLTKQERRCLEAASHGLDRSETAELLGIGVETVATHLHKARRLLRAKTTAHAVAEALRRGLIH